MKILPDHHTRDKVGGDNSAGSHHIQVDEATKSLSVMVGVFCIRMQLNIQSAGKCRTRGKSKAEYKEQDQIGYKTLRCSAVQNFTEVVFMKFLFPKSFPLKGSAGYHTCGRTCM